LKKPEKRSEQAEGGLDRGKAIGGIHASRGNATGAKEEGTRVPKGQIVGGGGRNF